MPWDLGVFKDPMTTQLAGLALMSGSNLSDAISTGMKQSAFAQEQKQQQAQYARSEQVRSMLPQLLQGVDLNDVSQVYGKLLPVLGAKDTNDIVQNLRLQRGVALEENMYKNVFGGGGQQMGATNPGADPNMAGGGGLSGGLQSLPDEQLQKMLFVDKLRPVAQSEIERRKTEMDYGRKKSDEQEKRVYEATDKPTSAEAAKMITLARQGLRGIDEVKKLAFDEKGGLKRGLIAQILDIPVKGPVALTPDAKRLYTSLYNMTAAKLRLDTGAAATDEEVRNNMKAYAPQLMDSAESASYKLDQLSPSFGDILTLQGRGKDVPVSSPKVAAPAKNAPSGMRTIKTDADFDALPSGSVFVDPNGKTRRKP